MDETGPNDDNKRKDVSAVEVTSDEEDENEDADTVGEYESALYFFTDVMTEDVAVIRDNIATVDCAS